MAVHSVRGQGTMRPGARTDHDAVRRRMAALSVGLATMMAVLDGTMINIALPEIARAIAVTPASAIYVVSAYQFAVALILLPLGRAGDVIGRRPVYFACLALFTLASIGCATANSLSALAAWRFVQGCGGAGMMGITNAMLRFIYPPRLLAKGMSLNTFVVTGALAIGPAIASAIVVVAGWRWLFLVNIPICVVALAAGWKSLPEGKRVPLPLDPVGMVLAMAAFGLAIAAVNSVAHGARQTLVALLAVSGTAAAIVMVRHQSRVPQPLFPIDLLRSRIFGISIVTMFAAAAAQTIAYVVLPFLLHGDLGQSQIATGALFLPWPIAQAGGAFLAGKAAHRIGPGLLSGCGLLVFATGLLCLVSLAGIASQSAIVWRMALCGLGWGIFQPPNSRAIITSVAAVRAGSASVMGAAGRVTGQACGAALVACLFRFLPETGRSIALCAAAAIALGAAFASLGRGMNSTADLPAG